MSTTRFVNLMRRLIVLSAIALAGCGGGGGTSGGLPGLGAAATSPSNATVIAKPFDAGTTRTWPADPARLHDDTWRSLRKLGWGRLNRTTADGVTDLTALHPNGATLKIRAWSEAEGKATVSIRAGHFGNTAIETEYLDKLTDVMAGDPMPQRDKTFEYPTGDDE